VHLAFHQENLKVQHYKDLWQMFGKSFQI
jgi:hypothetical protein